MGKMNKNDYMRLMQRIVIIMMISFSPQTRLNTTVFAQSQPGLNADASAKKTLLKEGIAKIKNGEFADAKSIFQKLCDLDPQNPTYYQALQKCELNANALEAANVPDQATHAKVSFAQPEKLISMNLENVDIRDLLFTIADEMGKSLKLDPKVQGSTSISLNNVSPLQALSTIAKNNRLILRDKPQHLEVYPPSVRRSASEMGIGECAISLKNISAENAIETANMFISEMGRAVLNKNSNILMVRDSTHIVEQIDNAFEKIDPDPKQIVVEAVILDVSLEDRQELGFNWFGLDSTIIDGKMLKREGGTSDFVSTVTNTPRVYAAVTYKSITALMDAIKTTNKVDVLSRPKILTIEGNKAKIIVGKKLGYRTVSALNQTTMENIEFLEVGTQLNVTPHILEHNNILMDIHPEVSDGLIDEQGLPIENTSEITTKVVVANGQTLVIGGLIKSKITDDVKQVPLLGSIPWLGNLFKRTEKVKTRSEIVVLLTPYITGFTPDEKMQKSIDKVNENELTTF